MRGNEQVCIFQAWEYGHVLGNAHIEFDAKGPPHPRPRPRSRPRFTTRPPRPHFFARTIAPPPPPPPPGNVTSCSGTVVIPVSGTFANATSLLMLSANDTATANNDFKTMYTGMYQVQPATSLLPHARPRPPLPTQCQQIAYTIHTPYPPCAQRAYIVLTPCPRRAHTLSATHVP